jgi:ribosome-binding factor A
MAKRFDTGTGPSQRQLRVGELMRHALSEVLSRGDIHDPVLTANVVTVPEVKMSPDLKIATCFIMPLGGKDAQAVIQALAQNKRYLRGELAHRTNLKFAPDLRFRVDQSFDEGSRIDRLLDSQVVRRDIGKPARRIDEDDQS